MILLNWASSNKHCFWISACSDSMIGVLAALGDLHTQCAGLLFAPLAIAASCVDDAGMECPNVAKASAKAVSISDLILAANRPIYLCLHSGSDKEEDEGQVLLEDRISILNINIKTRLSPAASKTSAAWPSIPGIAEALRELPRTPKADHQ